MCCRRLKTCTLDDTLQDHFHVDVTSEDGASVLTLRGELDLASAGTLQQALAGVGDAARVVIDLRALDFIDSSGIRVLISAHSHGLEHERPLVLIKGPGQVAELLELTGLLERLTVVDRPEELPS